MFTPATHSHVASPSSRPAAALPLSGHAQARLQQRGIPRWYLDMLLTWGRQQHDGHGARIYTVSKPVRQRLVKELPRSDYARAERFFDVYAVVSGDGTVITAAHKQGRAYWQ